MEQFKVILKKSYMDLRRGNLYLPNTYWYSELPAKIRENSEYCTRLDGSGVKTKKRSVTVSFTDSDEQNFNEDLSSTKNFNPIFATTEIPNEDSSDNNIPYEEPAQVMQTTVQQKKAELKEDIKEVKEEVKEEVKKEVKASNSTTTKRRGRRKGGVKNNLKNKESNNDSISTEES